MAHIGFLLVVNRRDGSTITLKKGDRLVNEKDGSTITVEEGDSLKVIAQNFGPLLNNKDNLHEDYPFRRPREVRAALIIQLAWAQYVEEVYSMLRLQLALPDRTS